MYARGPLGGVASHLEAERFSTSIQKLDWSCWEAGIGEEFPYRVREFSGTLKERITEEEKGLVRSLAADFPRLWNDPRSSMADKKRLIRLVVEDVTLTKGEFITAQVRFRGGTTEKVEVPLPLRVWDYYRYTPEAVRRVDELLGQYPEDEAAEIMNQEGLRPPKGKRFDEIIVRHIIRRFHLKTRYERHRSRGLLTAIEIARHLGVAEYTVNEWRRRDMLKAEKYDGRMYLYALRDTVDLKVGSGHRYDQKPMEAALEV